MKKCENEMKLKTDTEFSKDRK